MGIALAEKRKAAQEDGPSDEGRKRLLLKEALNVGGLYGMQAKRVKRQLGQDQSRCLGVYWVRVPAGTRRRLRHLSSALPLQSMMDQRLRQMLCAIEPDVRQLRELEHLALSRRTDNEAVDNR